MIFGYARVSTDAQDLSAQLKDLKAAGCERLFKEKVTGATAERPQLKKLLATVGHGDVVIIAAVDRLSRDTTDLLVIARDLQKAGAGLRSLAEPVVDTTSDAVGVSHTNAAFNSWAGLQQMLDLAWWHDAQTGGPTNNEFPYPPGITIRAGPQPTNSFKCASALQTALADIFSLNAALHVDQVTPSLSACKNECVEIDRWKLILPVHLGRDSTPQGCAMSGNFEFACSRILAFPFDVGLGLGDPIVVDLDQHGADKSD